MSILARIAKSRTLDLLAHYPVRLYVFASLLIINTALVGIVLALYMVMQSTGLLKKCNK